MITQENTGNVCPKWDHDRNPCHSGAQAWTRRRIRVYAALSFRTAHQNPVPPLRISSADLMQVVTSLLPRKARNVLRHARVSHELDSVFCRNLGTNTRRKRRNSFTSENQVLDSIWHVSGLVELCTAFQAHSISRTQHRFFSWFPKPLSCSGCLFLTSAEETLLHQLLFPLLSCTHSRSSNFSLGCPIHHCWFNVLLLSSCISLRHSI